ncbi:unnamed protein product [Prunus armeniaca]|uniref:Uncharacterized protein n=1 Tax=Prunus armeniaca TaxID=36596 RepID=A0A6J5XD95_PRUAR|nr:unnamed protein product [Prunus armeniaca]CAB4311669.1 unnamed protein product [Prunus armeniaca]
MPDGTIFKKGWFVTYHAYAMGRMEGIWGKNCVSVSNISCRPEDVSRKRSGIYSDEVDCSVCDGEV